MRYTENIEENERMTDSLLGTGISFDVKKSPLTVSGKRGVLYYIDGFVKREELIKMRDSCINAEKDDSADISQFIKRHLPCADSYAVGSPEKAAEAIHSGKLVLLIDTFFGGAVMDIRDFPKRGISEPDKSKTLRGPHEGFTESLITNATLLRRRIKTPKLRLELFEIGKITKTQIALCYIEGAADEKLCASFRKKLSGAVTDSLVMAQESICELLFPKKGLRALDPLPTVKYAERPDTASAMLCEGKILILCDTSPSVICLPAGLFDFLEEPDDYYFPAFTGTYLRLVRLVILVLSVFLVPVWLYFAEHPGSAPGFLSFVGELDEHSVPLVWQILIIELAVDGLKLASLNTPSTLSNSLSVVGGLLLGDFAVKSGWFVPQTVLYSSFTAIANFIPTNYEFGYSIKFMRVLLVCLTGAFGLYGLISGSAVIVFVIAATRTASGKPYLYPVIPFDAREAKRIIFRTSKTDFFPKKP